MPSVIVEKVYNKNTLREHPDASPQTDPSFESGHSYIFPGDEIVFCSTVDGPADFGTVWGGVTLLGARMSIIAKKLNVFSDQFDSEFTATREFELDSFVLPINTSNAPSVPWGTDGYAPNLNFTQDRAWQLPSGDFRRQVKAYTEHVGGTQSWKYKFLFPVIFREDYWNALIAADNDFYDTLEPQNGKNQKWLRYHNLAFPPFGWRIYYRFELQYQKFAITGSYTRKLVSDLDLSNEQEEIQDYESNPDYTLLSIKTCPVGGVPSNSPFAYIFGSQNTSCFGYFTKQTAWDIGEKNNLTAVFRVRPMEGGDRLGSRGSSKYPSTADVVWTESSTELMDENSYQILDEAGNTIEDEGGAPTISISFDPMDDKNIIVYGEIDYVKLALIYPGVNNFTLYCRLYNSTIIQAK